MKSYEEVAQNVIRRRDDYNEKIRRRNKIGRICLGVLTSIAMIVTALITTGLFYAVATGIETADWFAFFFADQSGELLTTKQYEIIKEGSVGIGQSVTADGYTITIDSAFCDKSSAHIKLIIEAPENIELEGGNYSFDHCLKRIQSDYVYSGSVSGVGGGWTILSDEDGKRNTVAVLMKMYVVTTPGSTITLADGSIWSFQLENLCRWADDPPHEPTILAEGGWYFSFVFPQNDGKEVECISTPIFCNAGRLAGEDVEITVTSFRLHALGAECRYTFPEGVLPEAIDTGNVQIVMKDGSVAIAHLKSSAISGNSGFESFWFDAPVVVNEVSHIVLPDNTKVTVSIE